MNKEMRGFWKFFSAVTERMGTAADAAQGRPARLLKSLSFISLLVIAVGSASSAWASPSTTTLTTNPSPPVVGTVTTITATVTGKSGTPTGTVTFTDLVTAATTTVTLNASGAASVTKTYTTTGVAGFSAAYSGDSKNSSSSTTLSYTVQPAATTLTISTYPSPVPALDGFQLIVTVNGGYQPTGPVTIYYGSTLLTNSCYVSNNVCVFAYAAGSPGQMGPFTASYSGDANNSSSSSSPFYATVVQETTTTSLSASPNPSASGQAVTLTANVQNTTSAFSYPSGTVTFYDGTTVLGTSTLSTSYSSGQATLSHTFATTGTHSLTATYSGDTNNAGSTSAAATQTVLPATTTALASSINPSAAGQATTLTATVAGSSPTGTVTFLDGTTTLGTGTLNGSGIATLSHAFATAGAHSLTASYGGDSGNGPSTSAAVAQTVNPAASTTALVANPNPAGVNQAVSLSATVTGASPTGTVTFLDGTTTLGTGVLNGSGVATLSYTYTATGVHSLTASYGGDANNAGSVSAPLSLTVGNPTTTQLTAAPNPLVVNQATTLTATVAGTNLTGTVTFYDGTTPIMSSVPLTNGVASINTSYAAKGTHSLTAAYSGDAVNAGSTSPAVSVGVYSETISYFHNDAEGTPLASTDAAGNLLWSESYRAYGDPVQTPLDANNNLWYTGKPYDTATQLSYLGARYYDPVLGRFMGVDPLDFRENNLQSFNRYAYANDNPNRFVDPDGRDGYDGLNLPGYVDAAYAAQAAYNTPPPQGAIPSTPEATMYWIRIAAVMRNPYQTPGQWLADERKVDHIDMVNGQVDNNVVGAERYWMAKEGYWDIFPGSQEFALTLKLMGQEARLQIPGASWILGNNGSTDPFYTESWGLQGAHEHEGIVDPVVPDAKVKSPSE